MNRGNDDSNDDDGLLLSLVDQSVDLILISEGDDSVLPEKFSPSIHHNKSISPSFTGNLHKICFQKKRLLASLKHWINSKVGKAKCVPTLSSLDAYLKRAKADGYCLKAVDLLSGKKLPYIAEHFQELSSETSLDVYHDGCLFQGVVVENNANEKDSILHCAAKLYRQLLWLRSIAGKNVSHVYGFSLCCGHDKNGEFMSMSKLRLEIPSTGRQIGARFPLFIHSKRQSLAPLSTISPISLLDDLGAFLLARHMPRPSDCEYLPSFYPGPTMLVSQELGVMIESETITASKLGSVHLFKIVPTITGSLVIRCQNVKAVQHLLSETSSECDHTDIVAAIEDLECIEKTEQFAAWYVKCKTPISFGPFWETTGVAINGTRRRLTLMLERQKSSLSKEQVAVANEWLFMHPADAILEPHRNLTIIRDMGIKFQGQLCWREFVVEFLGFLHRTLLFQNMTKLIHGDIHGGNLLLKAKKLVLIDWDEAAREKPFRRIALNDTEKCQYPSALISFPELYTKQQLLELFHYLLREYYPATKGENSWNQYQAKERIPESERLTITVGARYKTLCDFLSSELSLQETE